VLWDGAGDEKRRDMDNELGGRRELSHITVFHHVILRNPNILNLNLGFQVDTKIYLLRQEARIYSVQQVFFNLIYNL
jgi:hypothetical protein